MGLDQASPQSKLSDSLPLCWPYSRATVFQELGTMGGDLPSLLSITYSAFTGPLTYQYSKVELSQWPGLFITLLLMSHQHKSTRLGLNCTWTHIQTKSRTGRLLRL